MGNAGARWGALLVLQLGWTPLGVHGDCLWGYNRTRQMTVNERFIEVKNVTQCNGDYGYYGRCGGWAAKTDCWEEYAIDEKHNGLFCCAEYQNDCCKPNVEAIFFVFLACLIFCVIMCWLCYCFAPCCPIKRKQRRQREFEERLAYEQEHPEAKEHNLTSYKAYDGKGYNEPAESSSVPNSKSLSQAYDSKAGSNEDGAVPESRKSKSLSSMAGARL